MGAGIAKSIKQLFPAAYEADLATEKGSRDKLGTFSSATVDCDGRELTIVNAYTQFSWRGRGIKADYEQSVPSSPASKLTSQVNASATH